MTSQERIRDRNKRQRKRRGYFRAPKFRMKSICITNSFLIERRPNDLMEHALSINPEKRRPGMSPERKFRFPLPWE
jgi:hypothetical protein